eukprot:scaffold952_cov249-Pinguiococcus_pyrenoidosus.AAC.20
MNLVLNLAEEQVAQNLCFLAIFEGEAQDESKSGDPAQDDILAIEFTGKANREQQRQMLRAAVSAAQAARSFVRRSLATADRGRMSVWRLPSGRLAGRAKD